jgi:hypothetical protein
MKNCLWCTACSTRSQFCLKTSSRRKRALANTLLNKFSANSFRYFVLLQRPCVRNGLRKIEPGYPPNNDLDFLYEVFDDKIISNVIFHSVKNVKTTSNLTDPLFFPATFLSIFLKDKMTLRKSAMLELRKLLMQLCRTVSVYVCARVCGCAKWTRSS